MISNLTVILLGLSLICTPCGDSEHDGNFDKKGAEQTDGFETPTSFRSDLESALHSYLELTDALVAEHTDHAAAQAGEFSQAVSEISVDELDQSAADFWKEYSSKIETHASALKEQEDIDGQRSEFENISEALIEVVKAKGPLDMTLYQQRCPMVGDGEGDWLSSHEEIRNPYHGESMLNCGSTVEEL